jgi:hypothetical protein
MNRPQDRNQPKAWRSAAKVVKESGPSVTTGTLPLPNRNRTSADTTIILTNTKRRAEKYD